MSTTSLVRDTFMMTMMMTPRRKLTKVWTASVQNKNCTEVWTANVHRNVELTKVRTARVQDFEADKSRFILSSYNNQ